MKRAQEPRDNEFSVQKIEHETSQRLTSQMQEMQEQMNSVNDSGEFQKSGVGDCLAFPVNQQVFQILVLCCSAATTT